MDNIVFRDLDCRDYYAGYFNLLSQLTVAPMCAYEEFQNFVKNLNKNHVVLVVGNDQKQIIATGTIFIEPKLIHNLKKVCHIEDIIVDTKYRKFGIGKQIIDKLVDYAKHHDCYKVILDCNDENVLFYEKCGFKKHGVEMSLYF